MQVDPIKLTLKAPGTKRLKLKCDEPLSNFAFNINLRRYILARPQTDRLVLRAGRPQESELPPYSDLDDLVDGRSLTVVGLTPDWETG